jgi:multiple sugar transport system substrate-binding protein
VAEPVTDKITTADLCKDSDPFAGGFDLDKSDAFEWNKQLYALAGAGSVYPYLIYYNKAKFEEAGLDDPMTLYSKGKWTWSSIVKMGQEVTDVSKDVYFGCRSFYGKAWVMANGGHYITYKNGKPVENLTSPQVVNALTWLREIMTGSKRICSAKGGSADPSQFYKGNTYVYVAEANRYSLYAKDIAKESAFGYDKSNLGVVPFPIGPNNSSREYPTGWVNAHAAGAGTKDVRVALAWAKFMTTYKDPIQDKYAMSKSEKLLCQKLISGNINYPDYGYATSSTNINEIVVKLETAITTGSPVSTTLESYRKQVQNCIDASLKS